MAKTLISVFGRGFGMFGVLQLNAALYFQTVFIFVASIGINIYNVSGGEIRVARGSFVDHAFRTKFPYEVRGDLYRRNIVRIAEV